MIKCRLNVLLAERDLKQYQLVNATGIDAMTISKAARNQLKHIPIEAANKLCEYFNCSISHIWEYISDRRDGK
jgi:putative transcriptional regulator